MSDPAPTSDLLADAVRRRRARPWLAVAPDEPAHFYVRTAPYQPDHIDLAAMLRAVEIERDGFRDENRTAIAAIESMNGRLRAAESARNTAWTEVDGLRADLARAREVIEGALTGCHEWVDAKNDRCNEPAEFVLWGKLLDREALGPRCYDHATRWLGHAAAERTEQYAVVDLRPLRRWLAELGSSS